MREWERPTEDQMRYLDVLKARFKVSPPLFAAICDRWVGKTPDALTKRDVSTLIDTMKEWVTLPADLQRMAGQMDLF